MKDITRKPETLRTAKATATVHVPPFCISLLRERRVEKGDALEVARTAGMLAAKRTWELLPFCHPLPLQNIRLEYQLAEDSVRLECGVQVIASTGVEMEALTAVSIAALTLYDMLKPHAERELRISDIKLLEKTGGKSDFARRMKPAAAAVVLAIPGGRKHDQAGQAIRTELESAGFEIRAYEVLEDSAGQLAVRLEHWLKQDVELIATVGGTGVSANDQAVETVRAKLERELPGVMEAARDYGQRRTPYAMLSRGVAGLAGSTLLVTFPGSTRGAQETWQAIATGLVHTLESLRHSR
ncbi:MAG: bifunctional molybdenum cofactor biosynthesis protein MoaC/MoaB [Nevskiales bacterium]